ncbi:hypothetical protein Pan216_15850 [Planctomycetes bacterium Pan216]|uniref:Recombination-associated protein RdgC n=1 Tax=Kolteria novifilia TaxID=2527975 RepID=A0A518B189_9BACT|nr:hypothetical protein Pan216_15850 [Planctomycetes bacterium Pan216]
MGFLSGRVSYERFRVSGRSLQQFDQQHVDILDQYAIGKGGAIGADGVEMGFTAGGHVLDLDFGLEKNIANDTLSFGMRVDTNKPPADLVKAYTQLEIDALAAQNPSGFASRRQRSQAKETALERLDAMGKDGRFRKMQQFSALWDLKQEVVYFGASSLTAMERFLSLFKEAFDRTLERITAGTLALGRSAEEGRQRSLEDLEPATFVGPKRKISVAWLDGPFGSRDFLGNEFLLWLWWVTECRSDTIKLSDDTSVTCVLNKTLSLECPLNETGRETISSDAPTRLPEAKRAVLGGKWPRKTGMMISRHDEAYELVLTAESLAVGSASLPKLETDSARAEREERVDQLRHLTETLDLLFDSYVRRRLSSKWSEDLSAIRRWLEED